MAGGLRASASARATRSPSSCPTGWRRRPPSTPRDGRGDPRPDRPFLRSQGGRLHPPPDRGPVFWPCRASVSVTTWPTWRGRAAAFDGLEHRRRRGRHRRTKATGYRPPSTSCAGRRPSRAGAVDPTSPPSSPTPRGRPPTPRGWCIPTVPSAARSASWASTNRSATTPISRARRLATPSACWAACSARSYRGLPLYLIDGLYLPTVSPPCSRSTSPQERLHLFLHEPARLPELRARAPGTDEDDRPRRLAHPRCGGQPGRPARDLAQPLRYGWHRASLGHRVPARRPPRPSGSTLTAA